MHCKALLRVLENKVCISDVSSVCLFKLCLLHSSLFLMQAGTVCTRCSKKSLTGNLVQLSLLRQHQATTSSKHSSMLEQLRWRKSTACQGARGPLKIHGFSAQLMHILYCFQNWFHTATPLSASIAGLCVDARGCMHGTCLRRASSATLYNGAEVPAACARHVHASCTPCSTE